MPPTSPLETTRPLTLGELSRVLGAFAPELQGDAATELSGVSQDSRRLARGDLFVARAGASADGASFVREAAAQGAAAVLAARDAVLPTLAVPVLRVGDVRRALAFAAEAVYGYPSRALPVIGITGTNGKTTCSVLIEQALLALGKAPARLGTLGYAFRGEAREGTHTTPEADAISRLLAEARGEGATELVLEVSSHALELSRVAGLRFDVAAFTNLTQDHLDFHGSMAAYGAAKARLFTELAPRVAVIDIDDAFGQALAARVAGELITVARTTSADVRVVRAELDAKGIRAVVSVRGQRCGLDSRLLGTHNLENLLVALGVLVALGHAPESAGTALGAVGAVPGRLERCDTVEDDVLTVVDYAHTPDALVRVLDTLRPLTRGRLVCIFGCGGDRDPSKRPEMGRAVADRADRAFVTNDNPRSEDPEAIARAIVPALAARAIEFEVELDRARAIERAVLGAAPGDTLLIAGKGHEDYQVFGAEKRPFDDRAEARRALFERRRSRAH